MCPIIVTKCKCSDDNIYLSVPKERYFQGRINSEGWELEYSKRVKEEKYQFYKQNIRKSHEQWSDLSEKEPICEKCGKKLKI
jgi:uncharacterized protein YcnI|tara:strand:+ start:252 stop:497 length:246 start_codon:yes stop_codon:yes gene_type:complete